MSRSLRVNFCPDASPDVRRAVRALLETDLRDARRLPGYTRSIKDVCCAETPAGPLFIKRRRHVGWLRRLGRTVRPTKAEREFRNLLALRARGVPCPDPVAVARRYRGPLIAESLLVEALLADAAPLSRCLLGEAPSCAALLDRLFDFFALLRAKGVVHRDLHWDNLLVRSGPQGPELFLVDALHVRLVPPPAEDRAFAESVRWFLVFLVHKQATAEIVDGFLDRLPRLGLASLADRDVLRRGARDAAARL